MGNIRFFCEIDLKIDIYDNGQFCSFDKVESGHRYFARYKEHSCKKGCCDQNQTGPKTEKKNI